MILNGFLISLIGVFLFLSCQSSTSAPSKVPEETALIEIKSVEEHFPDEKKLETIDSTIIPDILPEPEHNYAWPKQDHCVGSLARLITPPVNSQRTIVDSSSFASWLRHLPVQETGRAVHLFDGTLKGNQNAHEAVICIDVGRRDLQQCADAVMRLRAEYLYSSKNYTDIHFNFTSGDRVGFSDWARGRRPRIRGNQVTFTSVGAQSDFSYANFQKYLISIFSYAGTASLSKEMEAVSYTEMAIGDVFIQGGFPGHAVIVVDMVEDHRGKKYFLLAQSYMPAQEMHILKNPTQTELSPWYPLEEVDQLYTPEWTFSLADLKRFR